VGQCFRFRKRKEREGEILTACARKPELIADIDVPFFVHLARGLYASERFGIALPGGAAVENNQLGYLTQAKLGE